MIVVAALATLSPPSSLPSSAPLDEFSAERALNHVQALARIPHPIGSIANTTAREYVVAQLSALGLNPGFLIAPA